MICPKTRCDGQEMELLAWAVMEDLTAIQWWRCPRCMRTVEHVPGPQEETLF